MTCTQCGQEIKPESETQITIRDTEVFHQDRFQLSINDGRLEITKLPHEDRLANGITTPRIN